MPATAAPPAASWCACTRRWRGGTRATASCYRWRCTWRRGFPWWVGVERGWLVGRWAVAEQSGPAWSRGPCCCVRQRGGKCTAAATYGAGPPSRGAPRPCRLASQAPAHPRMSRRSCTCAPTPTPRCASCASSPCTPSCPSPPPPAPRPRSRSAGGRATEGRPAASNAPGPLRCAQVNPCSTQPTSHLPLVPTPAQVSCNDLDLRWELDSAYHLEKLATAYAVSAGWGGRGLVGLASAVSARLASTATPAVSRRRRLMLGQASMEHSALRYFQPHAPNSSPNPRRTCGWCPRRRCRPTGRTRGSCHPTCCAGAHAFIRIVFMRAAHSCVV